MDSQSATPTPTAIPSSETISLAPTSADKNKSGIGIGIAILIVVALIALAGFAIFAIFNQFSAELSKVETQEKPALREDEILIGYNQKYFFTAKTYDDVVRNAAKSFDLYEYNMNDGDVKVTDLDSFFNRQVPRNELYDVTLSIRGKKAKFYTDNSISFGIDNAYYYKYSDDTKRVKIGEQEPNISLTTISAEDTYEIDNMTFTVHKDTKDDVIKMLGDLEPEITTDYMTSLILKGYQVSFYTLGDNLTSIVIHPAFKK